jgi:hypothetical protein
MALAKPGYSRIVDPGPTFYALGRLYGRSPRNWSNDLIFREVEDPDLIAKARRGNVEAYNLLVSRWEKRVFNYLLGWSRIVKMPWM